MSVAAWAAIVVALLLVAGLLAPSIRRRLSRGRRQADLVRVSIAAGEDRADVLPDGSAGLRRVYIVQVVNDGDQPVHDVLVECLVGRAAESKLAFGNQLPFHVWRIVPPQREAPTWTPEFTLPLDDAKLLSGRRPPSLQVEFTDAQGRSWRRDPRQGLRRWTSRGRPD
jgi:hypothetical protein